MNSVWIASTVPPKKVSRAVPVSSVSAWAGKPFPSMTTVALASG